jgi:hypothetical protein
MNFRRPLGDPKTVLHLLFFESFMEIDFTENGMLSKMRDYLLLCELEGVDELRVDTLLRVFPVMFQSSHDQ